jgi:hypothetical protein
MAWEIAIHESIAERIAADSSKALTPPERTYHALWTLLDMAYGPGLLTYFERASRRDIETVSQGFTAIGAVAHATVFQEALKALPADYFDFPAKKRNQQISPSGEEEVYKIEGKLQALKYPEEELAAYVQANEASFLGPRTKLELWNSLKKRGAATAPKFTVKKFDREREAEKDRPYSTRSCPNCDYPSPDYRPSCKACGFPHGRKED